MSKTNKEPWPTRKAMQQVYTMNLWGSNNTPFYSGEGSHDSNIVKPYIEKVKSFLSSFEQQLVVCDLGCGDFNIGRQFISATKQYIGVDIVPELIEYNSTVFVDPKVNFTCLDIAVDKLPQADCVIIRQVLQHLSNKEVLNITNKLAQYKYIILTEHLPTGQFNPNIDIISGQGIRLKKKSGIDLLSPL
ncbi:MAG: class I SAM-dependent methyltransferase [Flavobacteriales bacterium]